MNFAHIKIVGCHVYGLLKKPCIAISILYGACSVPIWNQGKQGRHQGNIRGNLADNPTVSI